MKNVLKQRAFNALCHSTHLYGRRLVLEWADSEETIDELRKKTAQHFYDGNYTFFRKAFQRANTFHSGQYQFVMRLTGGCSSSQLSLDCRNIWWTKVFSVGEYDCDNENSLWQNGYRTQLNLSHLFLSHCENRSLWIVLQKCYEPIKSQRKSKSESITLDEALQCEWRH